MSVARLPKAELHCHIEGAALPGLVEAQGRRYGVDTGALIQDGRYRWSDFTSFLAAYDAAAALFRTPEDYALLARSYLASLAAEGAVYSEIFVSPDHARQSGLDPLAYVEGLSEGATQAEAESGITCRFIAVGLRHLGPEAVEATARWVAANPHPRLTGFGMAGEERMGHKRDVARAFAIAREAGLGITVHAGELAGADSVAAALDHIRPDRIGHGVRAIEDRAVVERLAETGTVLEVCPHSNVVLGLYPSLEDHPLPRLVAAGCRVTLNSDDPPHFHTSLGAEYAAAHAVMGLDEAALAAITRTAVEAAFVDEATRARLLSRLDTPDAGARA